MDVWGVGRAVGRRWYVFVGVLLLIVPIFLVVDRQSFAEYTVDAAIGLRAAAEADGDGIENIYAPPTGTEVLRLRLDSPRAHALMVERGFSPKYVVTVNARVGNILGISATAPSEELASKSAAELQAVASAVLEEGQVSDGIPEASRVKIKEVLPPGSAQQTAGAAKFFMGMAALLLALAALTAVVTDRFLSRRSKQMPIPEETHQLVPKAQDGHH